MECTTWIIIISTWLSIGETGNCIYARLEEDYDSEGLICQWEEDDFNLIGSNYVLKEEDIEDNCIEAKVRKKYWEKRVN